MKNKIIALLVMVVAFSIALTANAQEASVEAEAEVSIEANDGANPLIRKNIRSAIEKRLEPNREVRNALLDKRKETAEEVRGQTNGRGVNLKMVRASSTEMFKRSMEARQDQRQERIEKMKANEFNSRKNALAKRLTVALDNLANISMRIESRIEKAESGGRDMTDAKALLVIANNKLVEAKADVSAFQVLNPTRASTTAEVSLEKPRVLGDAAIESVKEARDAFQKVVVSIAKNMGLGNASTTRERN